MRKLSSALMIIFIFLVCMIEPSNASELGEFMDLVNIIDQQKNS